MPTTVTTDRSAATLLRDQERQVLSAVGCGLRDDEIAAALAVPEAAVAEHLARILVKLGLRDRAAAIVHAFDCGLAVPGHGPRTRPVRPVPRAVAVRAAGPRVRISLLGPLQAWRDGRPLNLGHLRQQAVLAALALGAGRSLSQQALLDDVWGMEPPVANVVPVYIYRLRKVLRVGDGPDSVITRGLRGYQLLPDAVDVDVARMEELAAGIGRADRAGEPLEAVRLCAQALELFREEPLAGLPGPLAELERLRLTERRMAIVQRKVEWQLRLGQESEAIAELFALSAAHPLNERLAAMLMRALYRNGRRADAVTVFERARRLLAADLGVPPSRMLRRAHQMILCGDEAGLGLIPSAGSTTGP
ncbi:BTAD domain-containing putative transcriptional regulator [Streptomyces sp. NPDC057418]|uniref:BTAD domain-containing putative transcriptional regulator n=1 Tax=unclassified Streptomyces TaxID=2593676 RepID=UPI0036B99C1B